MGKLDKASDIVDSQVEAKTSIIELPDDSGEKLYLSGESNDYSQQAKLPDDIGDPLQTEAYTESSGIDKNTPSNKSDLSDDNNYARQSSNDARDISDKDRQSFERYTCNDYKNINKVLYDEDYSLDPTGNINQVKNDIQNITDCLNRKEIKEDCILYRGISDASIIFGDDFLVDYETMSIEALNEKYIGAVYTNRGFTSTSTNPNIAKNFAQGDTAPGALMIINVPQGAKGMCLGDVSVFKDGEKEVLLQRNTSFRIDSIRISEGTFITKVIVEVTAIGCSPNGGNNDD